MGRVVLDLDEDVAERLRNRAVTAGYTDAAEYVNALVERDLEGDPVLGDDQAFPAGPPH